MHRPMQRCPWLGWTLVASQGHQKLLSSLVLTETSFFLREQQQLIHQYSVGLAIILEARTASCSIRPTAQAENSTSCSRGDVSAARCFGELSSVCLAPPLAPLPRHPQTTRTARRRKLAGERRAAEGGAVKARYIHRSCPVGGDAHLQLDPAQSTGAPDPAADAAAQRHRNLEHDS